MSKEDLLFARLDLTIQIQALDEAVVENIAKGVGDALQDTQALALEIALLHYLGIEK